MDTAQPRNCAGEERRYRFGSDGTCHEIRCAEMSPRRVRCLPTKPIDADRLVKACAELIDEKPIQTADQDGRTQAVSTVPSNEQTISSKELAVQCELRSSTMPFAT